jgi:DNA-binding response OmpR family regulator/HPt (histidine-containing phosphotransfer) domain-containing protein
MSSNPTSVHVDTHPSKPSDTTDVAAFMREARQSFVTRFEADCARAEQLLHTNDSAFASIRDELRRLVHGLVGLAGSVGYPAVSERALKLEAMLDEGHDGCPPGAAEALAAMRRALSIDANTESTWSATPVEPSQRLTVLAADDDPDQRALLSRCLSEAGHTPILLDSAAALLDRARAERPSVILLDVNMPGINGYVACQMLKADPELSAIPVVFITARTAFDERIAGLSLGAYDYLCKPIDFRELLLRLRLVAFRANARQPEAVPAGDAGGPIPYAAFIDRARAQLARSTASVAIVRLPTHAADVAHAMMREDIRRRDLIGWYDRTHIALLCPEMTPADACYRLNQMIGQLPAPLTKGMHAGVASSSSAATTIEALLAEADEGLNEAHHLGEIAVIKGTGRERSVAKARITILIADDDPDVSRILDAHVRAAGYQTVLAFDGEDAVQLVKSHQPAVLVLDLMLPKITGFDVLQAIRSMPDRPKTLVLSGKSRERDITRAFEIGADDYVTKPFSPQELLARVARLLR